MARNTTITEEQILEAARAVFLEEGFGAQTAKIARRANVSEGSIFKRFPTKEALFFAALRIERPPVWYTELDRRVGAGDCRENLVAIFYSVLLFFHEMLPRTVTTLGSLGPMAHKAFEGLEHPMITDTNRLSGFLRAEIERGRLRPCDAHLTARLILGALSSYVFSAMITRQDLTPVELRQIAEGTLDFLWKGIAPDTPPLSIPVPYGESARPEADHKQETRQ
ncbi:MAG: transcriptional regulator RegN, TetR family [Chthonomonadaceae bacterium]|nr:transcriptional regulator RegN, TetR family [Chthonomonadaceae bacterium]